MGGDRRCAESESTSCGGFGCGKVLEVCSMLESLGRKMKSEFSGLRAKVQDKYFADALLRYYKEVLFLNINLDITIHPLFELLPSNTGNSPCSPIPISPTSSPTHFQRTFSPFLPARTPHASDLEIKKPPSPTRRMTDYRYPITKARRPRINSTSTEEI